MGAGGGRVAGQGGHGAQQQGAVRAGVQGAQALGGGAGHIEAAGGQGHPGQIAQWLAGPGIKGNRRFQMDQGAQRVALMVARQPQQVMGFRGVRPIGEAGSAQPLGLDRPPVAQRLTGGFEVGRPGHRGVWAQ